ncbi:DUF6021 family protein [Pseudomonas haemolytica]|uniref:Uncharacterized protein n=1 Tax=Pseudomonas haemolytica TaxID=2600065 RepID=A0A5P1D8C9_9PSED|nr:DUF6021 family protein [Pseudomonas haemolytica]MBJ2244910.1 hypothetical protein [Pseudomonas haemolytica]MBJ2275240.1 hypothetical protein [Pseudomonas haemolytica]MBK3446583.1 hypothetical protein [Pseudomonas haemolytica]MBK3458079.1 hypothetical protein [Pseudomonas haemolytica]MRJ36715.1 hypothetical protein [Pseudomonas haemolytica]
MNKRTDGPRSDEHASGKDELSFDPDSPDVADPQVDPTGPAIAPLDQKGKKDEAKKKPPYDPLGDLKK